MTAHQFDQLAGLEESLAGALQPIATADPVELSDLLGDDLADRLAQLDRLHQLTGQARTNLRKARGHAGKKLPGTV